MDAESEPTLIPDEDARTIFDAPAGEGAARPGTLRIGRFEVLGRLGAGGMGEVLLARDEELGRDVAAKVIRGREDRSLVEKFVREARVTGQLEHPHVVPVYEVGRAADDRNYFVMRRVEGETLRAVLSRADPPSLHRRLEIFVKICDAIAYAHSRGVVHRDLKPDNVMVGRFGEVYVVDWGLAKVRGADDPVGSRGRRLDLGASDTLDGTVMGTPAYMPPEQAKGEIDRIDERSDVYSLGAILHEILTGRPPFGGESSAAVLAAVLERAALAPSAACPESPIPWELDAVVLRAMARRRGERYPSVEALRDDVQRFLAGATLAAARYRLWQRAAKWARRRAAPLTAALAVLVAAGLAGWNVHRRIRERAEVETLVAEAGEALARGDWVEARARSEAAARIAGDPRATELIEASRRRERIEADVAQLSRAIESVEPYCYVDWIDIDARVEPVRRSLEELRALSKEPGYAEEPALWAWLGRGAWFLRDIGEAESCLARARELGSTDWQVEFALGRIALQRGIHDALCMANAPELNPRRDAALKRLEEASGLLEAARARMPDGDEMTGLLVEAWRAWAERRVEDVRRLCDQAISRWPRRIGVEEFVFLRAQVEEDPELRIAAFRMALEHRPHLNPWAHNLMGLAHLLARRHEDAIPCFEDAIRQWPDFAYAHNNRGVALGNLGRHREALGEYRRAIEIEPDHPLFHHNESAALFGLSQREEAEASATRAIDLEPEFAAAYLQRGQFRAERGDLEAALADFDRALEIHPRYARAHFERGAARERRGEPDLALEDYDRSLAIDADQYSALNNRGRLRFLRGDVQGAVADLTRATRIEPDVHDAWFNRAYVHMKGTGDAEAALADFRRAAEIRPDHHESQAGMGAVLAHLGRIPEARSALERAIELAPPERKAPLREFLESLR